MMGRFYTIKFARYLLSHIQFIFFVAPILLLLFYLDGWIGEHGRFTAFSLVVIIIWILLMKEVAFWTYIQEVSTTQKMIKRMIQKGFFARLNKESRIKFSIFTLRACLKVFSWIFIFIMGHTWLYMLNIELSYLLLISSSIVFYMATELRVIIKVAYVEFLSKAKVCKKERKQT